MHKKPLTLEEIIGMWAMLGFGDLFLAFKLDEHFSRHAPFLLAMGTEMLCKSYLLGHEASAFTRLPYSAGLAAANKIAREKFSHDLKSTVKDIVKTSGDQSINALLKKSFDGFTGAEMLKTLQAAYLECRYPVHNKIHSQFPLKMGNKTSHRLPLHSSGLEKFAHSLGRQVLLYCNRDFGFQLRPDHVDKLRPRRRLVRFKRLFLGDHRSPLIARRKKGR